MSPQRRCSTQLAASRVVVSWRTTCRETVWTRRPENQSVRPTAQSLSTTTRRCQAEVYGPGRRHMYPSREVCSSGRCDKWRDQIDVWTTMAKQLQMPHATVAATPGFAKTLKSGVRMRGFLLLLSHDG